MCVEEAASRISRPVSKGRRVRANTKWQSLPGFSTLSSPLQSSCFKSISIARTVRPPAPFYIAVHILEELFPSSHLPWLLLFPPQTN